MPNNKPIQNDEELDEILRLLYTLSDSNENLVFHGTRTREEWFAHKDADLLIAKQAIMNLIKAYSLQERIDEAKLYMKSYPKKNRTMNDLSKMTRAELDRHITDLKKELEAL